MGLTYASCMKAQQCENAQVSERRCGGTLEESMMVLRRWAMVMMVEPAKLVRMAFWMNASVSPSTLAVASSSTSTLGLTHRLESQRTSLTKSR